MLHSKHSADASDAAIDVKQELKYKEIQLNSYQLKLIYQQTKYMILLGVAMISSILFIF